jgi:spermidine synthase
LSLRRPPVLVFFALFTVSGFAGLIYQSIWSHYLKLFLGHAAYAQTLVLAIFMGGMAIGSWLVSRWTHRIGDLLRGYAVAELAIGVLAFLFHRVFVAATGWAFDTVLPSLGGFGVDLFKWSLASLLILPASVLLGTTFPLMSAGIMRAYPDVGGRTLAMLYFTNSFGAAFGVLASGFYLVGHLGLPGTILVAGSMNVVLALFVWVVTRSMPPARPAPQPARAGAAGDGRVLRVVLAIALLTGTASFIYEITWIRMLTLGLGASTHAFEVMLAAFILAMALGAYWFRNRITRLGNDLGWLAGILALKAAFAAFAIWIYGDVLALIGSATLAIARNDAGYVLTSVAGFVAASLLMFPSAFCAGISLPLATQVLTGRGLGEASIGRVYGANTAGCILGAAFATHIGMELLGVKGLTGAGALLDAGAALAALAVMRRGRSRLPLAAGAAVVVLGLGAFLTSELDLLRMSSGVYREGAFLDPATKLHFYRDGKTATVAVHDGDTTRTIRTNGKVDATIEMADNERATPDEYTMTVAAALPLALKPGAARVANIGFGSGLTTHVLLASSRLRELDNIEIERMMIEGARLFQPRNARAFHDPRSRIHIDDAKTFFSAGGAPYDVIVSEPSGLWVSGVATLFSEEFYAHVRRHLRDDGLLVQWIQAYEVNVDIVSSVFKALGRQFSDYTVYATNTDLLVVATPKGRMPQFRPGAFDDPGVAAELARLGILGTEDLDGMRVGSRASLEPLFARYPMRPNSDFFPVIDQNAARSRYKNESATSIARLRDSPSAALALLDREARARVARVSHSGLNRPMRVNRMLVGAEAVGVALTGRSSAARALEGAPLDSALLVNTLASGCEGAQAQWVNALTEVMAVAGPHLAGEDLAPLFEFARKSACWRALDPGGRDRVAFLEAVALGDPARVADAASRVLDAPARHRSGERATFLAAAMAGALATNQVDLARTLHERHHASLSAEERRALPMLLVEAHLQERLRRR